MTTLLLLVLMVSLCNALNQVSKFLIEELSREELRYCTVVFMANGNRDLDDLASNLIKESESMHDFVIATEKKEDMQSLIKHRTFCAVVVGFRPLDLGKFSDPNILAQYEIMTSEETGMVERSKMEIKHPVMTIRVLPRGNLSLM